MAPDFWFSPLALALLGLCVGSFLNVVAYRLPKVLENTSGFVYYVSMTGITGAALTDTDRVAAAVRRIDGGESAP